MLLLFLHLLFLSICSYCNNSTIQEVPGGRGHYGVSFLKCHLWLYLPSGFLLFLLSCSFLRLILRLLFPTYTYEGVFYTYIILCNRWCNTHNFFLHILPYFTYHELPPFSFLLVLYSKFTIQEKGGLFNHLSSFFAFLYKYLSNIILEKWEGAKFKVDTSTFLMSYDSSGIFVQRYLNNVLL